MSTYSTPGLFGEIIHKNERGDVVGYSWPGMFDGSYNHYNANMELSGHSDPGIVASYVHIDNEGHRTGVTYEASPGYFTTYDEDGFAGTTLDTGYGGDSDFDFSF